MSNENKHEQLTEKKQRTKGHGNRSLQRLKKQFLSNDMNNQANDMLKKIREASKSIHQDNQQIHYCGNNDDVDEEDEGEETDDSSTMSIESNNDMSILIHNQVG
ncbi:unnamed protein product [Adineta steineri]|uniref:Uncharacterized protein n=1 Tax=Adineta steineri TaxID=433720 RepID=A0A815UL74_9BILA|nr:unnamed protein product [Adineta steineri]CAF4217327.1 unnamed protein product [Adineta steineri]